MTEGLELRLRHLWGEIHLLLEREKTIDLILSERDESVAWHVIDPAEKGSIVKQSPPIPGAREVRESAAVE